MYLVFGIRAFQKSSNFFQSEKLKLSFRKESFQLHLKHICLSHSTTSSEKPGSHHKNCGVAKQICMDAFCSGNFCSSSHQWDFFVGRICFSGGKNITIFTWLVSLKTPNRAWKIQIYQMGKALKTWWTKRTGPSNTKGTWGACAGSSSRGPRNNPLIQQKEATL